MKTKLFYFLIIAYLIACNKDEKTATSVKDKLLKHTWKSTGLKDNNVDEDKWCWLNSLYNFTSDNKVFITQGDNLGACLATYPIGSIKKYTYSISTDEQWLIINQTGIGEADSFQIQSIDDTALKTKRVVNKDTAMPDTWEETFTAVP